MLINLSKKDLCYLIDSLDCLKVLLRGSCLSDDKSKLDYTNLILARFKTLFKHYED